jgi:hypothetical protein
MDFLFTADTWFTSVPVLMVVHYSALSLLEMKKM